MSGFRVIKNAVGSVERPYSKKFEVKSTFIHNLKNGIHDSAIIILECGSFPLGSRFRVTLHRIEQIAISSVDIGLCLKTSTELYDLKIICTVPVMLYIYINLSHISCIFFRVIYCNVEQSLKVCTLSVLPKVILDNYIHTANKTLGQNLSWESNGSSAAREFPRI
jgi:hypothetical protein